MIVFSTTDPRGTLVYFAEDRWAHAIEQHPELEDQVEAVKLTIESPDSILNNRQNSADLPQRTATERYVRRDGALNTNIVVAVKVVLPGGVVPGVGVVTTECREAWTAHSSYYSPKGSQLWPPITVL